MNKTGYFLTAIAGLLLAACDGQQQVSDSYDQEPQVLAMAAQDSVAAFISENAPQTVTAGSTLVAKKEQASEAITPYDFSVPASVTNADLSHLPTASVEQSPAKETGLPTTQLAEPSRLRKPDLLCETTRQDALLQAHAAQERQLDVPDNVGYRQGGTIVSSRNFSLSGVREREEHPNMLTAQRLTITASYTSGALSATAGATVNKYYALSLTTQYGIHGSMTYRFSPSVSATIFGEYYNKSPYVYMAAFPFISTSRYGGYVTLSGQNVGTHLGAERYYDPFVRHWELRPIVTPFVHVSKKMTIELPLGGLLKEGTDRLFHNRRSRGPIIMPSFF